MKERKVIDMQKYMNLGGNSGVDSFEIGEKYIVVRFTKKVKLYTYSYDSAGKEKVEHMKKLALQGRGLNEYINRFARLDYEK